MWTIDLSNFILSDSVAALIPTCGGLQNNAWLSVAREKRVVALRTSATASAHELFEFNRSFISSDDIVLNFDP
jgi:hypothetical protein